MDLHSVASGAISAVNPMITGFVRLSTGPGAPDPAGQRAPTFSDPIPMELQVQPLTWRDLQMLDGITLQGTRRAIYVHGELDGQVRSTLKGGDLIVIEKGVNAGTWLVAQVLEQFPEWCKVAATLQNGS